MIISPVIDCFWAILTSAPSSSFYLSISAVEWRTLLSIIQFLPGTVIWQLFNYVAKQAPDLNINIMRVFLPRTLNSLPSRSASACEELQLYLWELVQPQLHMGGAVQPSADSLHSPLRRARQPIPVSIFHPALSQAIASIWTICALKLNFLFFPRASIVSCNLDTSSPSVYQ